MNQANTELKWFYRLLLLIVFIGMGYLALQPSYNTAHWMPHNALRSLGINYQQLLWLETHTDIFLHLVGAFTLTLLLDTAKLPFINQGRLRSALCVVGLCVAAEIAQHFLGRGFESKDLLLGILGCFMAYLAINKNKKANA